MARWPGDGLAVAESLTCGGIQARIGAVSGASAFFRGGITAYTLEQKVRHLGVDRREAAACNCVSEGIALCMAHGAAELFAAEIAVATTGYAEPAPEFGAEVPFAWWALVHHRPDASWIERSERIECRGLNRGQVQDWVSERVLEGLLAHLREVAG